MPKKVVPIRAEEEWHIDWVEAAKVEGLKFSPWAARILNEAAAAVKAERLERHMAQVQREELQRRIAPSHGFRGPDPKSSGRR